MKTADTVFLEQPQVIDTLGLDTFEIKSQNTQVEDLISFDDCSFFAGDTLLHAEVPYRPLGFSATSVPFNLRNNGWSGLCLFLCLLLAVSLVLRLRKIFRELVRNLFFPIPGKMDDPIVDDPLRFSTRLVAVCLFSLSAAMVAFTYTQYDVSYYPFPETPYILFFVFFVLSLGYFLIRRLMSNFVIWIFFRSEKIFTWQRSYTFLMSAESVLFLIFALVVVYLPVPVNIVRIIALIIVVFFEIVLLFKTNQIFFPKMYGTLHLIVYFCTLELMPLLVFLQILTNEGWLPVVKI